MEKTHKDVQKWVRYTPVVDVDSLRFGQFSDKTKFVLKLELFQHTGTFKPRGALSNLLNANQDDLVNGVTAVSAGNHAVATAYAAKALGLSAKVVMHQAASPRRVALARAYGAEVVQMPDIHAAFDEVRRIEKEEGRFFVHPFEGMYTALGTSGVGYEFIQQVPGLDVVIVPIGGGGLAAGVAAAIKTFSPETKVYGVEPEGANTMSLSLKAGKPVAIEKVQTIADSLGAPHAAPVSFELCRKYIDKVVTVSDQELLAAMQLMAEEAKLAVEPAGAASLAGTIGPLREMVDGYNVGLIVCGANIAAKDYAHYLNQQS